MIESVQDDIGGLVRGDSDRARGQELKQSLILVEEVSLGINAGRLVVGEWNEPDSVIGRRRAPARQNGMIVDAVKPFPDLYRARALANHVYDMCGIGCF